jgi:hypothetical protein
MRVVGVISGVAVRVIWLVIAALVAFGSAGIAAAMNQPPGSPGRAELTAAGDAAMAPALDVATADLESLSRQVDALGTAARRALGQLSGGDTERLEATIAEGTTLIESVRRGTGRLEASLAAIPFGGDDWALHVSDGMRRRHEALAGTAQLTAGLEGDWARFTGRALAAAGLTTLLARHDEETAAAARMGSEGRYPDALAQLDASDASIALGRSLRDQLAATTDVATLTAWLDRNAAYDAALRDLYRALIASEGRVNAAVRKAFEREQAARAQLPGDTRAVVVMISDIAQGGLNQAVISIEQARGALAEALEVQERLREDAGAGPGSGE